MALRHSAQCQARRTHGIGGCWCGDPAVQANIDRENQRAAAAREPDYPTLYDYDRAQRAAAALAAPSWGERGPQTEAEYDAPEPYMVPAPRCPECNGPADTGAGHDCGAPE